MGDKEGYQLVKSYMANSIPSKPTPSQADFFASKPGPSQATQQSLSILDQAFLENPFEEMDFTGAEETSRTSDAETTLEKVTKLHCCKLAVIRNGFFLGYILSMLFLIS
jgi:hypothetical protein